MLFFQRLLLLVYPYFHSLFWHPKVFLRLHGSYFWMDETVITISTVGTFIWIKSQFFQYKWVLLNCCNLLTSSLGLWTCKNIKQHMTIIAIHALFLILVANWKPQFTISSVPCLARSLRQLQHLILSIQTC